MYTFHTIRKYKNLQDNPRHCATLSQFYVEIGTIAVLNFLPEVEMQSELVVCALEEDMFFPKYINLLSLFSASNSKYNGQIS